MKRKYIYISTFILAIVVTLFAVTFAICNDKSERAEAATNSLSTDSYYTNASSPKVAAVLSSSSSYITDVTLSNGQFTVKDSTTGLVIVEGNKIHIDFTRNGTARNAKLTLYDYTTDTLQNDIWLMVTGTSSSASSLYWMHEYIPQGGSSSTTHRYDDGEIIINFSSLVITQTATAQQTAWTAAQDNFKNYLTYYGPVTPSYTIQAGMYLLPEIETIQQSTLNYTTPTIPLSVFMGLSTSQLTGTTIPISAGDTSYSDISLHIGSGQLWVTSSTTSNNVVLTIDDNFYYRYNFGTVYLNTEFTTYDEECKDLFELFIYVEDERIWTSIRENTAQAIQQRNVVIDDLQGQITNAYNNGFSAGYDRGINDNLISDSTTGVITAIFEGLFGQVFKVEIFPNFPLYIFILIPVVFGILGLILWLVRGK